MANFISGLIKGGILSAVALATASVLLPARPKVPSVDAAQSAPLDPSPSIVDATQTDEGEPPQAAQATQAESAAASEAPAPAVAPKDAAPADVTTPEPSAPAVTKEALLDPNPITPNPVALNPVTPNPVTPEPAAAPAAAEPIASGAKMVAAPSAEVAPEIGTASISQTSQSISGAQANALTSDEPAAAPVADTTPPLQKYAAPFDAPDNKPLFAVILLDTGAQDLDRKALAALPFPVTFAIDPDTENASEAMAIYRAAGKEVVMLTAGLPNAATAQDLEQSFQSYQTSLPETVAVMGPATGGFQDNAVLSKLIVPVIAAQGRGMITFDRGLNSAAQNALREGLAQGTVFRQVDGAGESVSVIRRYLDRAVFKAAQDRTAIVMGQTLPNTITALTEWSLEGRAAEVTLAPVSAILR